MSDDDSSTRKDSIPSESSGSRKHSHESKPEEGKHKHPTSPKFSNNMDARDGYRENVNGVRESETSSISDSSSGPKGPGSKYSDLVHKNEANSHSGSKSTDSPKRIHKHGSKQPDKDRPHGVGSPHVQEEHKHGPKFSPSLNSPRHNVKSEHRQKSNSPHKVMENVKNDSNANKIANSPYSVVDSAQISDSSFSYMEDSNRVPGLDLTDYEVDDSCDVDSISGEINPPIEDNRVRLFVALFDYDPESMSPNVESLEEELPFKEGQIIKVNKTGLCPGTL